MLQTMVLLNIKAMLSVLLLGYNFTDNHAKQFQITLINESEVFWFSDLSPIIVGGLLILDYCPKGRAHHRRQY